MPAKRLSIQWPLTVLTMPPGWISANAGAGGWRYTMSRTAGLTVEPFVESFALGRSATAPLTSNGAAVGTVNEPRSDTRNYGLVISVSQRF